MTNILILGNGFDLAHHLPTKYDDFLGFSRCLSYIYTCQGNLEDYIVTINSWEDSEDSKGSKGSEDNKEYLKAQLREIFSRRTTEKVPVAPSENLNNLVGLYDFRVTIDRGIDTFRNLIVNNVWFHYFLAITTTSKTRTEKLIRGGNWIDFESEISFIVQHLDKNFEDIEERIFIDDSINQLNNSLSTRQSSQGNKETLKKDLAYFNNQKLLAFYRACRDFCKDIINADWAVKLRDLRDRLYNDLEDLISAFNFYLAEFVEKIPIEEEISFVKNVDPIYAISFNYTKTFERLYSHIQTPGADLEHPVHICHVHGETSGIVASTDNASSIGEADSTANAQYNMCNRMNNSNIVIGIDEYWETPEDQAKRTNFAIFKKFVQRIRKKTSLDYVKWLAKLRDVGSDGINIYIFGHSLNVTDKEILEPFLKSEKTKLHIYARNEASEGSLISNLILLIGRDAVIKKSLSKQIVFVRGEKS